MPLYRTKGVLTGTIASENVALAQAYLTSHDMTQYLHGDDRVSARQAVEHIEWKLEADGHNWSVTAFTRRELHSIELKELSDWVSGQNSDGLGEGFEQQDFAWEEHESSEEDCSNCDGTGEVEVEVDPDDASTNREEMCGECDGAGYIEHDDDGRMIRFDWETNECPFERIK